MEALGAAVRTVARGPVHVIPALDALPAAVAGLARAGDLIVTMGAGSIGGMGDRILAAIAERTAERPAR